MIMSDSPSKNKDRVLSCSVYCNGSRLKDTYTVVSATIRLELNRIGKASLRFKAGNRDRQLFDESDSKLFQPGTDISIDAGGIDQEETLFEGKIVGVRIFTDIDSRSYMEVECRDVSFFRPCVA